MIPSFPPIEAPGTPISAHALIEGFPILPSGWSSWLRQSACSARAQGPGGARIVLEWGSGPHWPERRIQVLAPSGETVFRRSWIFPGLRALRRLRAHVELGLLLLEELAERSAPTPQEEAAP